MLEIVGTGVAAGLAGCSVPGMGSTPSLQQAWFNLESSGDLRFALLFEDQVGISDPSKLFGIDEPGLETELDDSPESIEWYSNHVSDQSTSELLQNIDSENEFEEEVGEGAAEGSKATEDPKQYLDENIGLLGASPQTLSAITEQPGKVLTGTIPDYVEALETSEPSGETGLPKVTLSQIRFKGSFSNEEERPVKGSVRLQTQDGFIYQLPSETNVQRLENYAEYVKSTSGFEGDPLKPGRWNESVLVPELTHRTTPILQLLRTSAGRRRLFLTEVASVDEKVTTVDELVANDGNVDFEAAIGMSGPADAQIPFVYAAAPLAAIGSLVAGPAGAFAGIATAELLATLVALGSAADSASEIFERTNVVLGQNQRAVDALTTDSTTDEVEYENNRDNDDPPIGPTIDTTIAMGEFQFRHGVRNLARAPPAELETAISEHRRLLRVQRNILMQGWDVTGLDDSGDYPKTYAGYYEYIVEDLEIASPSIRNLLRTILRGVDEAITSEMKMLDQFETAALGSSSDANEEEDDVEAGVLFEDSFEDGLDAYVETEGEVSVTDDYAVDGVRSLHCSRPTDSQPPITWLKTRETFSGPIEIAYRIRFSTDNRYAGAHFDFGEYRVKHSYQAQQIGVHRAEDGETESGEERSFQKVADTRCEFGSGEWYEGTITLTDSEIAVERGDCSVSTEVADDVLETAGPLTVRAYVPDSGDDDVYFDELRVRRPK